MFLFFFWSLYWSLIPLTEQAGETALVAAEPRRQTGEGGDVAVASQVADEPLQPQQAAGVGVVGGRPRGRGGGQQHRPRRRRVRTAVDGLLRRRQAGAPLAGRQVTDADQRHHFGQLHLDGRQIQFDEVRPAEEEEEEEGG